MKIPRPILLLLAGLLSALIIIAALRLHSRHQVTTAFEHLAADPADPKRIALQAQLAEIDNELEEATAAGQSTATLHEHRAEILERLASRR